MKNHKRCAGSWATQSPHCLLCHIHSFSPLYINYKDLSICVQVPYTVTPWVVKTFNRNATHQLAAVPHSTSCWGMQMEDNKHLSTSGFLCSWQPCNSSPWHQRAVRSRHCLAISFKSEKFHQTPFKAFFPPLSRSQASFWSWELRVPVIIRNTHHYVCCLLTGEKRENCSPPG